MFSKESHPKPLFDTVTRWGVDLIYIYILTACAKQANLYNILGDDEYLRRKNVHVRKTFLTWSEMALTEFYTLGNLQQKNRWWNSFAL